MVFFSPAVDSAFYSAQRCTVAVAIPIFTLRRSGLRSEGAKRQPNGVRGSGVKTKEIECDIVLKHEGGKLGSPLLL